MKLRKLHLIGFGKFNNKVISLGEGLNVIYGPNEAGKSTVQKFIRRMFYGFNEPYVQKVNREEWENLKPWGCEGTYGGSIEYSVGEKLYRVERMFNSKRETVKIFDGITGEELTAQFGQDKQRGNLFALEHLGINQAMFDGTISIRQLGCTTAYLDKGSKALALELSSKIANLYSSGEEDVSVKQTLEVLARKLDELGTPKAFTKPLGAVSKRLEQLRNERHDAEVRYQRMREQERQLWETQQEIAAKEREKRLEEKRLLFYRYMMIKRCLKEVKEQNQKLAEKQELYNKEETKLRSLQCALAEYSCFEDMDANLEAIVDEQTKKIASLENSSLGWQLSNAQDKYKAQYGRLQQEKRLSLLVVFAGLVCTGLTLLVHHYFIVLVPVCLGWWWMIRSRKNKLQLEVTDLLHQIRELKNQLAGQEEQLHKLREELRAILQRLGLGDVSEFKAKWAKYVQLSDGWEIQQRYVEAIASQLEDTKSAFHASCEQLNDMIRQAGLLKPGAEMQVAAVEEEIAKFVQEPWQDQAPILISRAEVAKQEAKVDELNEEIHNLEIKEAALEASIKTSMEELRDLAKIEQEIAAQERLQKRLEDFRSALEIAQEVITEVSREVQREFAPLLNARMEEIITRLTGERYREVRVTQALEIRTLLPETSQMKEIKILSGGTVEQFYFALRVALADLIAGERKLPLIMDDSFIQYDDTRLVKALHFLLEMAKERQILLFTCQEREIKVLEAIGGEVGNLYNVIRLSL